MTGAGAKGGFDNEADLRRLFNEFDPEIFPLVDAMGYDINSLWAIKAKKFDSGYKPDIALEFFNRKKELVGKELISVKMQSAKSGFNQIDRGWVTTRYRTLWPFMSDEVERGLKLFTGEIAPLKKGRSPKRMYIDELPGPYKSAVLDFFSDNLGVVVSDVLAGRGEQAAKWLIVTNKAVMQTSVHAMDRVLEEACKGGVGTTAQGSLRLGRITAQRKGGDSGADSAKHLQFKANPAHLIKDL
jgi:hypothetical protein